VKLDILYEDEDFLAVDKPSGIEVLDLASEYFPGKILAHRLDTGTSGVLVLAKSEKARDFLKKQFSAPALEIKHRDMLAARQARVKKVYVAIVSGWVKEDRGVINKPIGRSPSDFRRRLAGRGVRGKLREAATEYKVLKRFRAPTHKIFFSSPHLRVRGVTRSTVKFHASEPEKFSLLEVSPKTGRTHQIRVHMKYINHPIVCDPLYNPKGACPEGLSRLALHAKSIEFKNLKGETVKIESLQKPLKL
jgi:23S rRNA pseudouridine1911/1915/1917 synthase